MVCNNCGNNSAQKYVRKTDGKEIPIFLCAECYRKLYPEAGGDDFFTSFLGNVGAKRSCPACGTTLDDFRATGLLGCAYCYTAFREELTPTVRYIQGKIHHEGKTPSEDAGENYDRIRALVSEREEVKAKLERSMQNSEFEDAELLRERLKEINDELNGGEAKL